jgi:hypothetical protein
MSASARTVAGACAAVFLYRLKSGAPVTGTVASFCEHGTWVKIRGIGVESRQALVRRPWPQGPNMMGLEVGAPITLQCVPDPDRPGKYKFRVMEG